MKIDAVVRSVKSVKTRKGELRDLLQVEELVGGRVYVYDLMTAVGRWKSGDKFSGDVVWDIRYRALRLA